MLYFSDFEGNSQEKTNLSHSSSSLLPNKRKCITCRSLDLLQWDVMKWHEDRGTCSYWIYTWKTLSKCSIDISNFFLNNMFAQANLWCSLDLNRFWWGFSKLLQWLPEYPLYLNVNKYRNLMLNEHRKWMIAVAMWK